VSAGSGDALTTHRRAMDRSVDRALGGPERHPSGGAVNPKEGLLMDSEVYYPEERPRLTPKEGSPFFTIMTDGSIRLEQKETNVVELHRTLLGAVSAVAMTVIQRNMQSHAILSDIVKRFDGLDPMMLNAIQSLITTTEPGAPQPS